MIKMQIKLIGRPDDPMYDLDWYLDELRDYLEIQGNIPEQGYFLTEAELEQFARDTFIAGWKERDSYYDLTDEKDCMLIMDADEFWAKKKKLLEKNEEIGG